MWNYYIPIDWVLKKRNSTRILSTHSKSFGWYPTCQYQFRRRRCYGNPQDMSRSRCDLKTSHADSRAWTWKRHRLKMTESLFNRQPGHRERIDKRSLLLRNTAVGTICDGSQFVIVRNCNSVKSGQRRGFAGRGPGGKGRVAGRLVYACAALSISPPTTPAKPENRSTIAYAKLRVVWVRFYTKNRPFAIINYLFNWIRT